MEKPRIRSARERIEQIRRSDRLQRILLWNLDAALHRNEPYIRTNLDRKRANERRKNGSAFLIGLGVILAGAGIVTPLTEEDMSAAQYFSSLYWLWLIAAGICLAIALALSNKLEDENL